MTATIIKPKKPPIGAAAQARVVQNTLTNVAKNIKVDFGVVTQTWKHKPDFRITSPNEYTREVATDDEVFGMLNAGTKAHDIRPKKPRGILRFKTPFTSKTLPNQIMSRAGATGSTDAVARVAHHPGTKARNWNKVIARKWQAQVGAIFQRALGAETK